MLRIKEEDFADRMQYVDHLVGMMVGKDSTEYRLFLIVLKLTNYDDYLCQEIINGNQKLVKEVMDEGFVKLLIHLHYVKAVEENTKKLDLLLKELELLRLPIKVIDGVNESH